MGGLAVLSALALPACGESDSDGSAGASGSGGSAGASGSAGQAGSAGSAGSPVVTTDKVDLLLVVDNSISMADKQEILNASLPRLVQRLVAPRCVDDSGAFTGATHPCPDGSQSEFRPLTDLHIGVISSSLGGHGGNVCTDQPPGNDHARLLPSVRDGLPDPTGNGFLEWKAGGDVGQLVADVAAHVEAAGEGGCGFESPLESWFRFLADPNPPESVAFDGAQTVASGTDTTILAQRKAFLRPDSLLSIVVLSDENDCSIRDSDVGWYVSTIFSGGGMPFQLSKPSPECATNPNDVCCRSCADVDVPSGCDPNTCDGIGNHDPASDRINVRCWDQKRRFGVDFMYPIARYVNALTKPQLCTSRMDLDIQSCPASEIVPNPIFVDLTGQGQTTRTPALVRFMSLVGVPWQALATEDSVSHANALTYLSASELEASGRWDWITGDSSNPPSDPLMVESMAPRSGLSPSTGTALQQPNSSPGANPANGHEYNAFDSNLGDLQYACIFPLMTPRDCDIATGGCDCKNVSNAVVGGGYSLNSPLCQDPATGEYSTTQHFAKAYPGLRYTNLLRSLGDQAVIASICPKSVDPASPIHGYGPALDALVRSMAPALRDSP